jgi:CBS-domain-containing membrane protein
VNTLKESDRDRTILAANVCDFVTRRSPHVSPSATPLDALELMVRENCDTLLVFDDTTQIKGIVTPVNFASTMLLYYRVFQTLQPLQRLRLVDLDSSLSLDEIFCRGAQTARDVMRSPVYLSANEPVACAIKLMEDEQTDFVALLDKDKNVTSVASRHDILMALAPPSKSSLIEHGGGMLSLVELLSLSSEPTLAEPVASVARGRLISVAPTSRLADTLMKLAETGRDAVMVHDNDQFVGMVTLAEVVRVFRTLMRLQLIKEK